MGKNIAGASVIRKDLFLTNFEYDSNPNFVILVKKKYLKPTYVARGQENNAVPAPSHWL
jgi:hypothetical protein